MTVQGSPSDFVSPYRARGTNVIALLGEMRDIVQRLLAVNRFPVEDLAYTPFLVDADATTNGQLVYTINMHSPMIGTIWGMWGSRPDVLRFAFEGLRVPNFRKSSYYTVLVRLATDDASVRHDRLREVQTILESSDEDMMPTAPPLLEEPQNPASALGPNLFRYFRDQWAAQVTEARAEWQDRRALHSAVPPSMAAAAQAHQAELMQRLAYQERMRNLERAQQEYADIVREQQQRSSEEAQASLRNMFAEQQLQARRQHIRHETMDVVRFLMNESHFTLESRVARIGDLLRMRPDMTIEADDHDAIRQLLRESTDLEGMSPAAREREVNRALRELLRTNLRTEQLRAYALGHPEPDAPASNPPLEPERDPATGRPFRIIDLE